LSSWQCGIKLVNVSLTGRPTRYREVVLTSWDRGLSDRQSMPLHYKKKGSTQNYLGDPLKLNVDLSPLMEEVL